MLANPSLRGIKAILLYPMNALAGDQARRFAKLVHNNPACFGKVRIGLYVGGEGDRSKQMTEDGVITCREEMRKSPPDILMTSYKMLDYLLIRQDDRGLWGQNSPDTLRYLVVDEIHMIVMGPIRAALAQKLGCPVRASVVWRLLARHGWRKVAPDTRHPKADYAVQAA